MFELVIGLEVHIQLNTKSKLFCGCSTSFGEEANKNTCPVCLGLPGVLPKLNKEAVIKAIKFGTAIDAKINNNSIFERKNYFYPDSPTGYQISQLEVPIVETGHLMIKDKDGNDKRIRINRAHLETDAGKSIHNNDHSVIDFNRVGTPLLEIVTEPDFSSVEEVTDYLKKLQTLVRHIGIGEANLQEGSFRCDVNISIREKGDHKLYTRVEIKNMNSFKFIEKAIQYEANRQIDAWEDGEYKEQIFQETRLFDTDKMITKSMRGKEEAADYRYFPDPDLLPVSLTKEILVLGSDIPELPKDKYNRYVNELGIKPEDADRIISDLELDKMFDSFTNNGLDPKTVITWLVVEYQGRISKEEYKDRTSDITKVDLSDIIQLVQTNKISGKAGKQILDFIVNERLFEEQSVEEIVKLLNLEQMSDSGELEKIVDKILSDNPDLVEDYKNGKKKVLGSFVGRVMKETGGKANPKLVNSMISEKLN